MRHFGDDVGSEYADRGEDDMTSLMRLMFSVAIGNDGHRNVFCLLREIPSNPAVRHRCQAQLSPHCTCAPPPARRQ